MSPACSLIFGWVILTPQIWRDISCHLFQNIAGLHFVFLFSGMLEAIFSLFEPVTLLCDEASCLIWLQSEMECWETLPSASPLSTNFLTRCTRIGKIRLLRMSMIFWPLTWRRMWAVSFDSVGARRRDSPTCKLSLHCLALWGVSPGLSVEWGWTPHFEFSVAAVTAIPGSWVMCRAQHLLYEDFESWSQCCPNPAWVSARHHLFLWLYVWVEAYLGSASSQVPKEEKQSCCVWTSGWLTTDEAAPGIVNRSRSQRTLVLWYNLLCTELGNFPRGFTNVRLLLDLLARWAQTFLSFPG